MYTHAASAREPRARQGSERCTDARHGRHAFSAARAVRFAAAATDGQSRRAGTEHFGSRPDLRRCWPRASPRPASSVRCCLTRPLWPARTGTACASCARAHRSSSAPADSLCAVWACRPPLLPDCCCAPVLVPTQRPPPGGHTAQMPALEPPRRWSHRQATCSSELQRQRRDAPSEGGQTWGSTSRPPWRPADPGLTAGWPLPVPGGGWASSPPR